MALTMHSHQPHARAGPAAPGPSGAGVTGMVAGVGASLVWGSAFAVPVLLGGWNPVIVTLGRYLVYGLLAAILFALGSGGPRRALREHWRTALVFALAGNAVYYLLLVIGIKAAGAPLTDMVIGAIPVVVAVTGNMLAPAGGRVPWRRLALPLGLVTAGLALVSALELAGVHAYLAASPAEKVAGMLAACAAVVLWTWYALANARFLARHETVSPAGWSTAVGVATGAVALAGLPAAALAGQLSTPAGAHPGPARLVAGVVFLGVVVSWAGTWLWNLASSRLSPAVAGLLVNLETVSGFGYVYAVRQHWPPAGQLAGLALVLAGVTLTLALTRGARGRRGTGAGPAEPAHTAGTPGRSARRLRRDQPGHRRPAVHQPPYRQPPLVPRVPQARRDQPDRAGPPRPHRPGRPAVAAVCQLSVRYRPPAARARLAHHDRPGPGRDRETAALAAA